MASILNATTTNGLVTSADNSGSLQLQTNNGTTAVTIDTSQNVGIGTSSPLGKMTVKGLSGYNLTLGAVGTDARIDATNDNGSGSVDFVLLGNSLKFNTTGSERMRITSGGQVGIGTTTPGTTLNVFTGNTNEGLRIQRFAGAYYSELRQTDNPEGLAFLVGDGSTVAERMRITGAGNLLVGTTTNTGTRFISVTNNNNTGQVAIAGQNQSSASSNVGVFDSSLGTGNASNTNCFHFRGVTENVAIYYLYGNGTSSFTSDARLKTNIETARDGYIDDLMKLRVVKYQWKANEDSSAKELGLIAQEVEQVFPGLVQDADVEMNGFNPKVLKASVLPFMLLKAIQEQQAQITDMSLTLANANAMIEELKAEVQALKGVA